LNFFSKKNWKEENFSSVLNVLITLKESMKN